MRPTGADHPHPRPEQDTLRRLVGLRIARELHDSLTHSISIVKLQAGVAVHLARKRGTEVEPALLAIQEASGEAMRELRGIEVIGEAADGRAGVELVREHTPDVVLMDVQMPLMTGIEATREIASGPALGGVHVVVLTNYRLDEYVFDALRADAAGFLLKDTEPAEPAGHRGRGER